MDALLAWIVLMPEHLSGDLKVGAASEFRSSALLNCRHLKPRKDAEALPTLHCRTALVESQIENSLEFNLDARIP